MKYQPASPLQDRLMSLLVEPLPLADICQALAPAYPNRKSIYNTLRAMKRAGKLQVTNAEHRAWNTRALWLVKSEPTVNALEMAWPYGLMPARLPGVERARYVKGVLCD